jgi:SAM-dependent methyltransferase
MNLPLELKLHRWLRAAATRSRRAPRWMLRTAYGFDAWHTIPRGAKPYIKDIVAFLNGRPATSRLRVVEIGCGLGDILRALRYEVRLGLDVDERVLRGARLLSRMQRQPVIYRRFDLLSDRLEMEWDAIVIVNWPHLIPPEPLADIFREAIGRLCRDGVLIVDTVDDPEYAHHHSIEYLTAGLSCAVSVLGRYPRGRTVFIVSSI